MENSKEPYGPEFTEINKPTAINKLGNTELSDCFMASLIKQFNIQSIHRELNDDPRVDMLYQSLNDCLGVTEKQAQIVYSELLKEANCRGLDSAVSDLGAKMYYDEAFREWVDKMKYTPTYVREVYATNNLGNSDIEGYYGEISLDFPVREACKVLKDSGYSTYWSSANINDFESRKGDVVKDKSTAYILIDHHNLSPELKESLFLDGKCKFWGVAPSHSDDGKYYGIWSEITSPNMLCSDLSNCLVEEASRLPKLGPNPEQE
ncbi:MAG: hypothetical protein WCP24_03320 [bacterium]